MNTTLYGAALAEAYDALNDGIDYEKICDFLLECVKKHSDIEVKDICEAACGTGSMACALARRGYHVVASDISEDMLSAADRKANAQNLPIRFVLQDMRRSVMYAQKDLYLCLLDSMNYLLTKDDILSALSSAKSCLKPGGLFIFDMNSKKSSKRSTLKTTMFSKRTTCIAAGRTNTTKRAASAAFIFRSSAKTPTERTPAPMKNSARKCTPSVR